MEKIHEIPNEFIGTGEVKGFRFKKLDSNNDKLAYEVRCGGGAVHYEVFERKLTPLCVDFKNRTYSDNEFKVKYPKAKDFGVWAKSFHSKERAIKYLINGTCK